LVGGQDLAYAELLGQSCALRAECSQIM
jgi:hypothetical protein